MNRFRFAQNTYLTLAIAALMLLLSALPAPLFSTLSLERAQVAQGQVWRIFTANFVHFGWAHTLMNLAAFLICGLGLLQHLSTTRFLTLMLVCSLIVGGGVYWLNPEYETYAGLSGVIHGLIVAGLVLNRRHAYWVNGMFIAAVAAKIIYEHQANYQATELQNLLPVAVAYDAHLYGAIAGGVFGLACLAGDKLKRKR